jgi:hypothetical protein
MLLENAHGHGSIFIVCDNEKCGGCAPVVKYEEAVKQIASLKAENDSLRALIIDLDVKSATTRKNGTAYIQLSAKIETLISINKLQQEFYKPKKASE